MSRVLIIEDDMNVRNTLVDLVRMGGYSTISPERSDDVPGAIGAGDYDLVITDVLMPDMDGLEVLKMVRATHPASPVLAISGGTRRTSPEMMLHMTEMLGADATLKKPFSKDELYAVIDRLLHRQ